MKRNKNKKQVSHRKEELVAAAGAVAGGMLGAIAGPPGIIAGSVIGGAIGALAGHQLENQDGRAEAHDAKLDEAIGVSGGDIGAAPPNQPPAVRGAYSIASTGAGGSADQAPSEGPLQTLEKET